MLHIHQATTVRACAIAASIKLHMKYVCLHHQNYFPTVLRYLTRASETAREPCVVIRPPSGELITKSSGGRLCSIDRHCDRGDTGIGSFTGRLTWLGLKYLRGGFVKRGSLILISGHLRLREDHGAWRVQESRTLVARDNTRIVGEDEIG